MQNVGVNVDVGQTLTSEASTGDKYFDNVVNSAIANPNAKNKNAIYFYVAVAAAVVVFFVAMKGEK